MSIYDNIGQYVKTKTGQYHGFSVCEKTGDPSLSNIFVQATQIHIICHISLIPCPNLGYKREW